VAELEENPRDSTHATAGDADQLHAMPFLRQEFCKIDVLRHI
jgi:hypothetical protein